jgi:hypothetical protein
MLSLYHAYESYERRVLHGELEARLPREVPAYQRRWAALLGNVLIKAGAGLKRHYGCENPLACQSLTRSVS